MRSIHRTKRLDKKWLLCLVLLLVLIVGGCGQAPAAPAAPVKQPEAKKLRVGLVFDVGGRGDKSFNDAAVAGLDKAADELGLEAPKELSPSKDEDREANLKLLTEGGYSPIIGVGFAYADSIKLIAEANPDTSYVTIDTVVEADNVRNNVFAEEQG